MGVGYVGNNYAATYSYFINISASPFTNFRLKTIHTDDGNSFSEQKPTIRALYQQTAPRLCPDILTPTKVCRSMAKIINSRQVK